MAEDFTRDSVIEGGYDCDFVTPIPDRLVCNICHLPCREPQQTHECGHLFCKSCIKKLMCSTTVSHACPVCRKESFTIFSQLKDDREIKALKVYCPNKSDGCTWIGELVSIIGHKLPEKCTPCDRCSDIIHYTNITNHLGTCPCYCPYCDITAEREVISSEHKEKCHKFPIMCPNKCGLDHIPRDNMDKHKKVCPLEVIPCEYQCGAMIARNEVDRHNNEKMTEHMQLTFEKTTTTIFNELHNDIRTWRSDMPSSNLHKDVSELHKKVDDLHKGFSDFCKECKGISGQGAQMEMAKQDNMRVSPIRPHLTTIVLCVIIAILMLLLLQSESVCGSNMTIHDGEMLDQVAPCIIRMANFAELKRKKEGWHSKPFLAFNEGYQMCLSVNADGYGDGKGTHVSVFLHLMKGPHDDKLEQSGYWPLRGTFTIELLNQVSDKDHHSRKIVFSTYRHDDSTERVVVGNEATKGWGHHQFISHSTLLHHSDNGYLRNDALYFRISYIIQNDAIPISVLYILIVIPFLLCVCMLHIGKFLLVKSRLLTLGKM